MKKCGFTLAEVLITLGIIGVVAALSAPALVQNTGTAQIGPKLAKAVSTFEVANENLLNDTGASTIIASGATSGDYGEMRNYGEKLSNYMKINYYDDSNSAEPYKSLLKNYNKASYTTGSSALGLIGITYALGQSNGAKFISKEGILYVMGTGPLVRDNSSNTPAHKRRFGFVLIDINGTAKPNQIGKDAFPFMLTAAGTLVPYGSKNEDIFISDAAKYYWKDGETDKCNETTVTSGWSCAGSIFENNLKVIYQ